MEYKEALREGFSWWIKILFNTKMLLLLAKKMFGFSYVTIYPRSPSHQKRSFLFLCQKMRYVLKRMQKICLTYFFLWESFHFESGRFTKNRIMVTKDAQCSKTYVKDIFRFLFSFNNVFMLSFWNLWVFATQSFINFFFSSKSSNFICICYQKIIDKNKFETKISSRGKFEKKILRNIFINFLPSKIIIFKSSKPCKRKAMHQICSKDFFLQSCWNIFASISNDSKIK